MLSNLRTGFVTGAFERWCDVFLAAVASSDLRLSNTDDEVAPDGGRDDKTLAVLVVVVVDVATKCCCLWWWCFSALIWLFATDSEQQIAGLASVLLLFGYLLYSLKSILLCAMTHTSWRVFVLPAPHNIRLRENIQRRMYEKKGKFPTET
jgi:hypothetical protein